MRATAAPAEVNVLLRNPGADDRDRWRPHRIALLEDLRLNREAHLVIRNGTLVPGDARLEPDDMVEIRPVISGGS
jgi:sulfur carrier protein